MGVRCFWLEPTGRARLSLRCYADGPCPNKQSGFSYHNARLPLYDVDECKEPIPAGGPRDWIYRHNGPQHPGDVFPTHAWPERCACGFLFTLAHRQVFKDSLYRRLDTGEIRPLGEWDSVPGAMWDCEWMADIPSLTGPDGRSLHVVCPSGVGWQIDGRASNCTKPEDSIHKCWVRHGEPPNITVGKDGGPTCSAGAGSIIAGNYHGFLRNGVFEP